jgi:hypothetical protein
MPRPIIHHRDHEHGGADPVRIQWESTGESGGGSILTNGGTYTGTATTSGGLHTFPWTHAGGNTPLDLTSSYSPSVVTTGVYAFTIQVQWAGPMPDLISPTYTGPTWFYAGLVLDAASDGLGSTGANQVVWQVSYDVTTRPPAVIATVGCTWYLPDSAVSYAFVSAPDTYDFEFSASVQQVA